MLPEKIFLKELRQSTVPLCQCLTRSFLNLVYSSHFGVFYLTKLIFCGFLHIEGNFACRKKRLKIS